jgi:hypothetical protein
MLRTLNSVLTWAFVLLVLLALGYIFAQISREPTPIVLQWGETRITTVAPVAIMLTLVASLILVLLGRALAWLKSLPMRLKLRWLTHKRHLSEDEQETALLMAVTASLLHSPLAAETLANLPSGPLRTMLMRHAKQQLSPAHQAKLHQWLQHPKQPFPVLTDDQTTPQP